MFKHYFALIDGVAIYPIISMILFLTFFVSLLIWVFSLSKKYVHKMENMPLELDSDET
ncbi:MAG: CcoQ/FixQ family Cbb3-type cytochrome c oxidase assembly chaperone [Microscillaceae bacterium]|jgi:cbb3-type cytochrome oxidase subunit 3|nr:CcoQ/FixQ family Cbb3-type cytochrome c oxidase assembly chaperone [Microscillaceae bacterium]